MCHHLYDVHFRSKRIRSMYGILQRTFRKKKWEIFDKDMVRIITRIFDSGITDLGIGVSQPGSSTDTDGKCDSKHHRRESFRIWAMGPVRALESIKHLGNKTVGDSLVQTQRRLLKIRQSFRIW